MKRSLYLIVLLAMLASCSPQKRLNRLLKRHPELFTELTTTRIDTVITTEVVTDTTFLLEGLLTGDTVFIEKEKLQIKMIRNLDSIYVYGHCRPDTLIIERNVPVLTPATAKQPIMGKLIVFSIILMFIAIIIGLLLSFYKKLFG